MVGSILCNTKNSLGGGGGGISSSAPIPLRYLPYGTTLGPPVINLFTRRWILVREKTPDFRKLLCLGPASAGYKEVRSWLGEVSGHTSDQTKDSQTRHPDVCED